MKTVPIALLLVALLVSPATAAGPLPPPRPLLVLDLESHPDKLGNQVTLGTVVLRAQPGVLHVQIHGRGFAPDLYMLCELRLEAYPWNIPLGSVTTGAQGSFSFSRSMTAAEIRQYTLMDPLTASVQVVAPTAPVGYHTSAGTDVVQIDMTAGTITP